MDNPMRLRDRVVVVTGAASGIGAAASRQCVREGAKVVLVDRDADRLEAVRSEFGDAAVSLVADVADTDAASRYVERAVKQFGRIDAALLNAGMAGRVAPIDEVTAEEFDRLFAVNVRSVWSGLAALFPVMKAQGRGSIVATASTGGLLGMQRIAPYIASKHAVIGLVKSAALEGARAGIRVNAVAPAPIDTPMMQHINTGLGAGDVERSRAKTVSRVPLHRFGTPEEVSKMLVFLASDESTYCTGGVYLIDGGVVAGTYP
jgi:NAD(P)-dependent dehydrogenase (short-subunit alcohol dehydrogenase family)